PRSGAAPVTATARPSPSLSARDSLHVTVVYPAVTDVIQSHDSAFLFGVVRGGGGGAARGPVHLGNNGQAVPVLANGAWIACPLMPRCTGPRTGAPGHQWAGDPGPVREYGHRLPIVAQVHRSAGRSSPASS